VTRGKIVIRNWINPVNEPVPEPESEPVIQNLNLDRINRINRILREDRE